MGVESPNQQLDEKQVSVAQPNEQAILNRQLNGLQDASQKVKQTPWLYATKWDKLVLVLSSITGIVAGAANPFLVVCLPECLEEVQKDKY